MAMTAERKSKDLSSSSSLMVTLHMSEKLSSSKTKNKQQIPCGLTLLQD